MQETLRRWPFIGLLLVLVASLAWAGDGAPASTPPPIVIIPQDGFNLVVDEQIDSHYVVVKLASPVHNWFAGTIANLPTDKEVTIGLCMKGMDTPPNKADVSKWVGLHPVMTYADPTKFETYEWFQRDGYGRWVSGSPFKQGNERYAGTGKVPKQSAIPPKLAEQFLSMNGKYWQAWREVDQAEAITNLNIFRIKQHFDIPSATIAMRVPYTYTYQMEMIARLQKAKLPGVYIDEIGKTTEGRKLLVIRVETNEKKEIAGVNKANLIYGREHGTEHASSWLVCGAISSICRSISDKQKWLKDSGTWLFIPIIDCDGSYNSRFNNITDAFRYTNTHRTPIEVISITQYLRSYVLAGKVISFAISIHNIECSEGTTVFSPFGINPDINHIVSFNRYWFDRLNRLSIPVGNTEPYTDGWANNRLNGWCWSRYGTFALAYEINDRYPTHRFVLKDTDDIGNSLLDAIDDYVKTDIGMQRMAMIDDFMKNRIKRMDAYYEMNTSVDRNNPGLYEIISHGF